MKTVRLAFYKAQKGDFWGNMISGYTGLFNWNTPQYCHVEIGFFLNGKWRWYSSASKNTNGTTGTRWLENDVLFEHPERWDVCEVKPVREIQEMIKTCDAELGKPYDWAGIAGFATPFGQLNSKKKWYCSEVCNFVFFGKWKKRISPKHFFRVTKQYVIAWRDE